MSHILRAVLLSVIFWGTACSSLPRPTPGRLPEGATPEAAKARALLEKSAAAHGNAWGRNVRVEVGFDGKWTRLITRIQPILTDPDFRRTSVERYDPRAGKVVQNHQGPAGIKQVQHQRKGQTRVIYNKNPSTNPEVLASAALVADAYTLFVYGSSWLRQHTTPAGLFPAAVMAGELCDLVVCQVSPGFGPSPADQVIAWIGQETGLLRRVQFSLEALDSTRGADVDVAFSQFKTASDGSVWPTHFLEYVRRPFVFKAHEWTLTSLKLDGALVRWISAAE